MNRLYEKADGAVNKSEAGFSLIESIVAMLIITIAVLGTLQAINYSVLYNAGNATRAQNLAILQQEVERLRAAKFTPSGVDNAPLPGTGACRADAQRDITGGVKANCTLAAPNGGTFEVRTSIDDNPFNGPNTFDVDATTRVKEITVEVRLAAPSPGWQTAIPARVILRRSIGN
jgi:prepilin-type N-terminal cleavage/methylation domain-containing protein